VTNLLASYEIPYLQVHASVVYIVVGILQFSPHETSLSNLMGK